MGKVRLTRAGAILLAKAIAGNQITFVRGAFGDAANHDAPSDSQIDNLTGLLNERMRLPISNFKIEGTQAVVICTVKNESVTAGFRVAEGGLFARAADSTADSLYAYFYDGDDGDFMPAGGGDVQLEYNYEFATPISNAQNVTAVIDKSVTGITRAEFEEHINSTEPHPNLDHVTHPELNSVSTSLNNKITVLSSDFNSHVDSTNPHPNWNVRLYAGRGLTRTGDTLNVNVASAQELGAIKIGKNLYMDGESLNADSSGDVDTRLKQLEINQANIFILLEEANKLGMKSNLIMVEDFKSLRDTRFYSKNATLAAASDSVTVDSFNHLRPDISVVITDGQRVNYLTNIDKIVSIVGNKTVLKVKAAPRSSTNAKLLRSTVTVKDGKAYGAGLIRNKRQTANKTWKGEGSSEVSQVTWNASENDSLDGDWLINDGYFTME